MRLTHRCKGPVSLSSSSVLVLSWLLVLSCAGTRPVHRTEQPPRELLQENLARATYVLEVEVAGVERAAVFRDDSGAIGYAQYAVKARPTRVIKGDIGGESPLSYRFTVEYDPTVRGYVIPGRRYVVFLKRAEDGQLWLFSEAAQFPSSPHLVRQLGVD